MAIMTHGTNITDGSVSITTGSFSGVITSTVTTGTAPFTVASTTVVTNLNVQYLNGIQSSGFATSGANSNITSLTGLSTPLSVAQGGTGASTTATMVTNLLDVQGGLVDRENTVLCLVGTYPSITGGAITITEGTIILMNMLTGSYAWIRGGTYTLGGYGALVANWDYKTVYSTGATTSLVPTVVIYSTPTSRPHFNLMPIAWYDGVNIYFKNSWAFPPYM